VRGLSGNRGKVLFALVGVGISALFLWLAVRNADLDSVRDALADARLGFVLLAVLAIGVGYGFQSARWRRIAGAPPRLGLSSFYGMLLGGLACNNVLPIRVGEIVRAGWLSRDAPMPGGRAFGSVVLDRICDVVTLAAFFAVGLQAVASAAWLVRMGVGAVLAVLVIATALVLARVYSGRRRDRTTRKPRGRVVQILRDTVEMLGEPIGRRRAATWIGLTACTWALSCLASALVARSIGIDLSPLEAVFVTSSLALGVAIPSSPGYVGTYQWVGVAALGLLDVPVEQALAFSILMQASWYVPTTLVGGAFIGVRALRGKPVHVVDPDLG
jgi:glycosyltransferase 2 family protein